MTSREHARRLLLVLLASERNDAPGQDATGERTQSGGHGDQGDGTDAGDGREAGDDWRMWASPSPIWGVPRLP
jgi:hypothetical protein